MSVLDFCARNISVFRGERQLIGQLDLSLGGGDIVHLIGPNGCGKTSLLRVLAGLSSPEQGEVSWQGQPIARQLARFHQSLGWLGHRAGLKADLTLLENIRFDNRLRRQLDESELRQTLQRLGVEHRLDVMAGGLSAGQRRRVALARILMTKAPLWLLDEPFTNLDDAGRAVVCDVMREHALAGGAVLFAAHHAVLIDGVAVRRLEWQQDV